MTISSTIPLIPLTAFASVMDGIMNKVRKAVSKKKRRYQKDGYDLDLTYIKMNLIAMGFPADKMEGVYRNPIDQVVRLLESKHRDHYRVYNLCAEKERTYDEARFHNRVVHFPFHDHNPPKIELIEPFCHDVDQWLAKDSENVAVIHCKAGKGRTGVMICSYLLHRGSKSSAEEALEYYAKTRTTNAKGVTIPSQRRYVHYYEKLLQGMPQPYKETTLFLQGIKLRTIPKYSNLTPQIVIWKSSSSAGSSIAKCYEGSAIDSINRFEDELCIEFPDKVPLSGDILITVNHKPKMQLRKDKLFQFWFNTFFVRDMCSNHVNGKCMSGMVCKMSDNPKYTGDPSKLRRWSSLGQSDSTERRLRTAQSFQFVESNCLVLSLTKGELDKANKDRSHKLFSPDFEVICYFEKPSDDSADATGLNALPISALTGEPELRSTEQDDDLSDTDTDTDDEESQSSSSATL